MAGIRERDKRRRWQVRLRFQDSLAYKNFVPRLFYVRNMFFLTERAPSAFEAVFQAATRFVVSSPLTLRLRAFRFGSGRSRCDRHAAHRISPGLPTQPYGGDPLRKFCIFPLWEEISFSNVRGWAPTYSIGFRRPRRRTRLAPIPPVPIPMCPLSVSPAPGFISSTGKPENSWATSDTGRVRLGTPAFQRPKASMANALSRTPSWVHFCTFPPERIPPQRVIASGVTGSNGEPDCAGQEISNGTSGNLFEVCNGHHGPGCRRGLSRQGRRPFGQE